MTHAYKLVLIGNSGVGKSSIAQFLATGRFCDVFSTIGAAYCHYTHHKDIPTKSTRFDIWDSAGSERYHSLVPLYLREVSVILMVYDAGDVETYNSITTRWMKFVEQHATNRRGPIIKVIVENKSDLSTPDQTEIARKYAEDNSMMFFQTSPKTFSGIYEMISGICEKISGEKIEAPVPPVRPPVPTIPPPNTCLC